MTATSKSSPSRALGNCGDALTETAKFSPVIGFVILSHEADEKLPRLIESLNCEYDSPPIVVHHDFGQAKLDRRAHPGNVAFVEQWLPTSWASWSVVAAALRAFEQLRSTRFDWAFLLSSSDYPVRRGREVRRELADASYDALIDFRPCLAERQPLARAVGEPNSALSFMDSAHVREVKTRFAMSPQLWLPIVRRRPRWRIGRVTYRPPFQGRHPFHNGRSAFYGDQWWGGNRKAVDAVLEEGGLAGSLRQHYRMRTQVEESYYCSVLANREDLVLCRDNRRFAEWNGGGAHPQVLTERDLPAIIRSNAYFARKFAPGSSALDAIDSYLRQSGP